MNKPPIATNMHLCCRDANHKHLYLLVNTSAKTGVAEEKMEEKGWGSDERVRVLFFDVCNKK